MPRSFSILSSVLTLAVLVLAAQTSQAQQQHTEHHATQLAKCSEAC